MWERPALPFVFMLFLGAPVLALNANGLRNKLVEIPKASPAAALRYAVDGLALGAQVKSGSERYQRYQCSPSDQFSGFISCNEEHTTPGKEVTRSHSILQSQDGAAYYINSYFEPAFFDPNDIQNEINRMSSEFGQQARVIQMPQREGLPNAVMAIWGAIQLEPLNPDELSKVASGGSHPGILVSFLGDVERSAKAGVPVYRLAGSAGFLWAATFDQNGRGVLRYLAIDDSKIEPSRQVVANPPAPVPAASFESGTQTTSSKGSSISPLVAQPGQQSRSQTEDTQAQLTENQSATTPGLESGNQTTASQGSVNPLVAAQPSLQQQELRPQTEDAQAQGKESEYRSDLEEQKRLAEEADRQRQEAQQPATIIEVVIAIFVLLCGVAVATFLRMKRQTALKQIKVCEEHQIASEDNRTEPIEATKPIASRDAVAPQSRQDQSAYVSAYSELQRKRLRHYRDRAKKFRASAAKTNKRTDLPALIQLAQLCDILADGIMAQLHADTPHRPQLTTHNVVATAHSRGRRLTFNVE
jgi:hypothetical protein